MYALLSAAALLAVAVVARPLDAQQVPDSARVPSVRTTAAPTEPEAVPCRGARADASRCVPDDPPPPACERGSEGKTSCAPPPARPAVACADENHDGRCDLEIDAGRQGGFRRAVARFVLLSWLRGEDEKRNSR